MASTSTLLRSIIIRSTDQLVEDDPEWQPILHAPNQIVLYNPTSHALTIRPSTELLHRRLCPYCRRLLPLDFRQPFDEQMGTLDEDALSDDEMPHARAPDYFRLLAVANETYSRPTTPPSIAPEDNGSGSNPPAFTSVNMAQGYFEMFFEVECKLGMGANGSVFLCQHILDGNRLGHFAVKKVAVGESHSYLLNILKEVRLLETLQHPNIITYHHAWLETSQFSSFGPRIPTLHVLMQWAEGGSLDDLIDVRQGKSSRLHIFHPADPTHHVDTPVAERESSPIPDNIDQLSRSARVRAFRAFQRASPSERERIRKQSDAWKAVHLFSAEEVHSLFSDIVAGLSFLHSRSILHLDLKPANILLTWVEGRMTPRAMLSDFGTSRDMLNTAALRSGNTGTLEYASPESLPSLQTGELRRIDSKSDMWSFGMVLHKLLFFRLPYRHSSDEDGSRVPENEKMDRLEREVREYPGFKSSSDLVAIFTSRHLPSSYLVLLESLLNPSVVQRPSIEKVSKANMEGKFDPLGVTTPEPTLSVLVPSLRRHSSPNTSSLPSPVPVPPPRPETEQTETVSLANEKSQHLVPAQPSRHVASLEMFNTPDKESLKRLVWRALLIRFMKSAILVIKVATVTSVCPGTVPGGVLVMICSLAVVDTLFDGVMITFILLLVHVGLMYMAQKYACFF